MKKDKDLVQKTRKTKAAKTAREKVPVFTATDLYPCRNRLALGGRSREIMWPNRAKNRMHTEQEASKLWISSFFPQLLQGKT